MLCRGHVSDLLFFYWSSGPSSKPSKSPVSKGKEQQYIVLLFKEYKLSDLDHYTLRTDYTYNSTKSQFFLLVQHSCDSNPHHIWFEY